MRTLCGIGLIAIIIPWAIGIGICLWRFFSEKWDKAIRYFELMKEEKQLQKNLREYADWYRKEQIAVIKACILNNRYERKSLFSKDDLKIWKAFI